MKKLLLLAFGLLIAATAAYCVPKEFKEFKIKPVIEKVFTIDHQAPAIIVDQINLNVQKVSPDIIVVNFENAIIEENKILLVPSEYRWHRITLSDNYTSKARKAKMFIRDVNGVNKLPDKK